MPGKREWEPESRKGRHIEAVPKKEGELEFSSPEAIEAISLSKTLSTRISLPIETQHPKEKSITGVARVAPEEHWLDLPDGRMRYLKAGSGPALILIHGLMGYSFS